MDLGSDLFAIAIAGGAVVLAVRWLVNAMGDRREAARQRGMARDF